MMSTGTNKHRISISRGICLAATVYSLLLFAKADWATTHIVQFGGNAGLTYSPNTFSAAVGDTVKWEGDFSIHPLSSTTIPSGAQSWHNATGTTFAYVIAVPGAYHYQCDVHAGLGMTGSFQVSNTAVRPGLGTSMPGQTDRLRIVEIVGQKGSGVRIAVPRTEFVTLAVFDLLGHEVATIINQKEEAGTFDIALAGRIAAPGFYFVRLTGEGEASTGVLRVPR
jgi:plastocyanin